MFKSANGLPALILFCQDIKSKIELQIKLSIFDLCWDVLISHVSVGGKVLDLTTKLKNWSAKNARILPFWSAIGLPKDKKALKSRPF